MADVYLAQDQLLGREVAVKVLHHHFAEDQEFVERFRREASSAAGLSHPNIVGIFDRGEWNGTYYIAMEYVAGRSLKAIVREGGALDPAQAIDIVVQILRAARFAHKRGVIHRDLKPHNVILDEEGRARVTDFGIARAGASDMTLTGSIMGTAQYLSPEQAQGYAVSAASDLYSVGVILYELLTGVGAVRGRDGGRDRLQAGRPPSRGRRASSTRCCRVSLDAVVLRALAKDPVQRYADAEELIAALEREREALPALAGAVLPVGRRRSTRRRPPAAARGAPLLLAPATAYRGAAAAERADERRRRALLVVGAAALAARGDRRGRAARCCCPPKAASRCPTSSARANRRRPELRHAGLVRRRSRRPSSSTRGERPRDQPEPRRRAARCAAAAASRSAVSSGPASAAAAERRRAARGAGAGQAARAPASSPSTRTQADASGRRRARDRDQPPAACTVAQRAAVRVTVLVSSGPAPVKVPGRRRPVAQRRRSDADQRRPRPSARSRRASRRRRPGTVLAQAPQRRQLGARAAPPSNWSSPRRPTKRRYPTSSARARPRPPRRSGSAGFSPHASTTVDGDRPGPGRRRAQPEPAGGAHAQEGLRPSRSPSASSGTPTTTTPTTTPTTAADAADGRAGAASDGERSSTAC